MTPTPDARDYRNFSNRTLYHGDNLEFLRGLNSGSVDLIATDPPFNKGRDFHATPDSLADGGRFQDRWSWLDDVQPEWIAAIERDWPGVSWTIEAARQTSGEDMAAFLCFLGVRLIEMHRVLAAHGSIYLHCDDTADYYIRALMDAIFGRDNFRNAITWKRTSGRSDAQRFGRVSDRILYFVKGDAAVWNGAFEPLSTEYADRKYTNADERGRYMTGDLTGAGVTAGESGKPWRGTDPSDTGRHWALPKTGAYADWIEREVIPGYRNIESVIGRLDALDAAGLIHWQRTGSPRIKRYLEASRGVAASDIVTDIGALNSQAEERTGYPTQKPIDLYERIIAASSNPGDVVLDPFAGCATTPIAAEKLGRQWLAMDLWDGAHEVIEDRMRREVRLDLDGTGGGYEVRRVTAPPVRTDDGEPAAPPLWTPSKRQPEAWERLTARQIKDYLLEAQADPADATRAICAGCGESQRARNLEVDHRQPRKGRGQDAITNRVLLCGGCNRMKAHRLTVPGLRGELRKAGELVNLKAAETADANADTIAQRVKEGRA